MTNTIETLTNFITAAERSRKYNSNSASGYRTALKLFEAELHEEEKSSLEKFIDNLQPIYAAVVSKNQTKYSAASLEVYRRRVSKIISDYSKYGKDPTKMSSWEVKATVYKSKKKPAITEQNNHKEKSQILISDNSEKENFSHGSEATIYPVPIRGEVVHVRVPNELSPLTSTDVKKISTVLSILFDVNEEIGGVS